MPEIDRLILKAVHTAEARLRIEEALTNIATERDRYRNALMDIAALDPADSEDGNNEWGEAEMFHCAHEIAMVALAGGKNAAQEG